MRKLPLVEALLVLCLTLGVVSHAAAVTGTCADAVSAGTWRVTWTTTGGNANLTKLEFKANGTTVWTNAATLTWEMRWENEASAYAGTCMGTQSCTGPGDLSCPAGESCNGYFLTCGSGSTCSLDSNCLSGEACWIFNPPFQPTGAQTGQSRDGLQGTLSLLQTYTVPLSRSPRLVTPAGYCTIYLNPFANGTSTWKNVAVFGDSLTASLNDATYNQTNLQGYVQGNLNTSSLRAEVEGQGGRTWTGHGIFSNDPAPLEAADRKLLDEIRGLRTAANLRAIIIELGANDAGWVAYGSTDAERQSRLATVQTEINGILDEIVAWNKCVVLVTGPDNLANYLNANPWHYAWAAQNINGVLRTRANASSTDKLLLRDFAALSANHHTWNPDSWFVGDNLHLNIAGKLVLTNEIVQAALSCPP